MTTTSAMTVGRTRIETAVLIRVRQERLRQLSGQSTDGVRVPKQYVPRHRADVRAD